MDQMESRSLSDDVKTLNEDSKQDGADNAANSSMDVGAENFNSKSMENPDLVSESMSCHDESTVLEDVKVCDICGDAGREDLLAVCSRCSDGAEHIYCMRIRLEKVPDADWICEDCVLSEDKEKRRPKRFSDFGASPKYNIDESDEEIDSSSASNLKVNPLSTSKGLDLDKNRRDKLNSLASAKRPLGNAKSALLTRRRALGLNIILTSRQYSRAPKSHESSVKSNRELPLPTNLSGRGTRENTESLTVSKQNPPKLLTSSGVFTKSKSFSGSERRPKVQLFEKKPEKQKYPYETLGAKGKGCAVRSFKKSLSFNDASAGCSSALNVESKTGAPKLPEVSDLKRLRQMKECSSAEMEVKPVLKKPRVLSPDAPFSSASSGTGNADEVKKLSTKPDVSLVLKPKDEVTSSSLTSRRHISYSNAAGLDKTPFLEKPAHQNLKVSQSCDSKLNDDRTYDGAGPVQKFDTAAHATNSHSANYSSVSAVDIGREKDLKKSYGSGLSSPLYHHLNINGSLAVPMFEYIWKGEFEIYSTGWLPGCLCRIQAHLSTRSSPKIPEVVKKFSDKIRLQEVSRLDTWPTQFLKHQPKDDSIGLYFFAQDIESYSKYKNFLQRMIDHDLALKGSLHGIELLIFSSNLLPEKSQCWNKLLFMWGIFRQTKFIAT